MLEIMKPLWIIQAKMQKGLTDIGDNLITAVSKVLGHAIEIMKVKFLNTF